LSPASQNIKGFIDGFYQRKGAYVLSGIVISKLLGFVLSVYVIHSITTVEYGLVSYAYNFISFIAPFAGFGIFQSLSRYGPLQGSQQKKRQLFKFVLIRGLIASILLSCIVILFAGLITHTLPESYNYLVIISLLIISHFIFEVIKIYFRIYNINKLFAYLEISYSVVLIILGVILTYYWGGYGYLASLVLTPLIISGFILVKHKLLAQVNTIDYTKPYKRSLWVYGLYTSLGGLTSQLIFSIDILTIGFILHNPADKVALYKAASIIPFALLFIPTGVMKTDLIKITQHYQDKIFLKNYVKNYLKLFFIISIIVFFLFYFFSSIIMSFFGPAYSTGHELMVVFAFGLVGAFLFRSPFGNIITCVGWAKTNTIISIITLVLDIVLNIIFVQKYGIIGAAYTTSALLWFAGLASYIAFRKYLNTLN